jgi:hypothetical protein
MHARAASIYFLLLRVTSDLPRPLRFLASLPQSSGTHSPLQIAVPALRSVLIDSRCSSRRSSSCSCSCRLRPDAATRDSDIFCIRKPLFIHFTFAFAQQTVATPVLTSSI